MFQIAPVLIVKPMRAITKAMILKITGKRGTKRIPRLIHTIFIYKIPSKCLFER